MSNLWWSSDRSKKKADDKKRHSVQLGLEQLEVRAVPAVYTVNLAGDAGIGAVTSGDIRYVINQINSNGAQKDIINFTSAVGSTITLTQGQLLFSEVGDTVIINGGNKIIKGTTGVGYGSRIFQINSGVEVNIDRLTITGGNGSETASSTAGFIGGNIYNAGGVLELTNSTVSNGFVQGVSGSTSFDGYGMGGLTDALGGGILNAGNLTVDSTKFINNVAIGSGGGNASSGSGFGGFDGGDGRDAFGGAIYNVGYLAVVNKSSFTNNKAIGGNGGNGSNGENGVSGAEGATTDGGHGGNGGSAGAAYGGAIFTQSVVQVTIDQATFTNNSAISGLGGKAGNGGIGGNNSSPSFSPFSKDGGLGGNGGTGGASREAVGGAIAAYSNSSMSMASPDILVSGSTFTNNSVFSQKGGDGGNGGIGGNSVNGDAGKGGNGGNGGTLSSMSTGLFPDFIHSSLGGAIAGISLRNGLSVDISKFTGNTVRVSFASKGGNGGRGGASESADFGGVGGLAGNAGGSGGVSGPPRGSTGGGIGTYFSDHLNVSNTQFTANKVFTDNGIAGGNGGDGGAGKAGKAGGSDGLGGKGGKGGDTGGVGGGAIYAYLSPLNLSESLTLDRTTFTNNEAKSGNGGIGGNGGKSVVGAGVAGMGGNGGAMGNVKGGAIFLATQVGTDLISDSKFTGNKAVGGTGGTGGKGGNGGNQIGAAGGRGGTGGGSAEIEGGAIAAFGTSLSTLTLTRTVISNNQAIGGVGGIGGGAGASSISGGAGGHGGVATDVSGGGVKFVSQNTVNVIDVLISGNKVQSGNGGKGANGNSGTSGGVGGIGGYAGNAFGGGLMLVSVTDVNFPGLVGVGLGSTSGSRIINNQVIMGTGGAGGNGGNSTLTPGAQGGSGGAGGGGGGAGIYQYLGSSVSLNNTLVSGNTIRAGNGGAGGVGGSVLKTTAVPLSLAGGSGGEGGDSGIIYGAGVVSIYNTTSFQARDSDILSNTLTGGTGGAGGRGGAGLANAGRGGNGGDAGSLWGAGLSIQGITSTTAQIENTVIASNRTIASKVGLGGAAGAGANRATLAGLKGGLGYLQGGGLFMAEFDEALISSSEIHENVATGVGFGSGGGIYATSISSMTITNETEIMCNSTSAQQSGGGGIYLFQVANAVIAGGTKISQNKALQGSGGGIYSDSSNILLDHAFVTRNQARVGGGIYKMEPDLTTTITLVFTNVTGNKAIQGYTSGNDLFGTYLTHGDNVIGMDGGFIGIVDGVLRDRVGTRLKPIAPPPETLCNLNTPVKPTRIRWSGF